jgi:pyruvate,water dikinase
LQARPITTNSGIIPLGECLPNENVNFTISRSNIAENYPEAVCPLLFSVARDGYYFYFKNLARSFGLSEKSITNADGALRNIVCLYHGHIYYNLTSVYQCFREAPKSEFLARAWRGFLSVSEDSGVAKEHVHPKISAIVLQLMFLVKVGVHGGISLASLPWRISRFESRVEKLSSTVKNGVPAQGWHTVLIGFWQIRTKFWNDAALGDAATMFSMAFLRFWVKKIVGAEDSASCLASLLESSPNLISRQPLDLIEKMLTTIRECDNLKRLFNSGTPTFVLQEIHTDPGFCAFLSAFTNYIDTFGFRSAGELMLTYPSYLEAPEKLIALLQKQMRVEKRIDQPKARIVQPDGLQNAGALTKGFLKISALLTLKCIGFRERARLKQAQLYALLRQTVLACGAKLKDQGILEDRELVFFLEWSELESVMSGGTYSPKSLNAIANMRKDLYEKERVKDCPITIKLSWHEWLQGAGEKVSFVNRRERMLHGTGVSNGVVSASAHVVKSLEEIDRVVPGTILVTRNTDPGWAPVFPLIRGLVLEQGGLLCHGAIVAREFGIPTVSAVSDATRIVTHGSMIKVDGRGGTVELLS